MCFVPSAASPCSARWRQPQRCERVGNNTELGICYPAVLEIKPFSFSFSVFPDPPNQLPLLWEPEAYLRTQIAKKIAILCLTMLKCLQSCNTDLKSFWDFPWHMSYQLVFAFEVNTQKKRASRILHFLVCSEDGSKCAVHTFTVGRCTVQLCTHETKSQIWDHIVSTQG